MKRNPSGPRTAFALCTAGLLLLASSCKSQEKSSAPAPAPSEVAGVAEARPRTSVSVGVSSDSFQANFRRYKGGDDGYWDVEAMNNEHDDYSFRGRIMRTGEVEDTPLRLGVGLATYAVFYDRSGDDLYALAVAASVEYGLSFKIPMRLTGEVSFAPEPITFGDGEELFDTTVGMDVEVGNGAVAFIGARYYKAETDNDSRFTRQLLLGVRIGL